MVMKLKNWKIGKDYKKWECEETAKIKKAKSLKGNNLTHKLEFFHFGGRVDFYLNNKLYLATSSDLLLNCEVFRINHDWDFWTKLLRFSKRIN